MQQSLALPKYISVHLLSGDTQLTVKLVTNVSGRRMKFPVFTLAQHANTFGSNRYEAALLRSDLERFLQEHQTATLDFTSIPAATQSWVDGLLGGFVLKEGAAFTKRVKFKGCTPLLQELIRFVITDRVHDYEGSLRQTNHPTHVKQVATC